MGESEAHQSHLAGQEMLLEPRPCVPSCIRGGYEFASKRAEARLQEPLRETLRQLGIRPHSLQRVTDFMEQRLDELRFPRKPKIGLPCAVLSVLVAAGVTAFCLCAFIYAWVVLWILLVPGAFLSLRIANEIGRAKKPYAEWADEDFWAYWNSRRRTPRRVPKEIRMVAEEVQMALPGCRLTVHHLHEDAFLCARHRGVLGADDELYILEHWGAGNFGR